MFERDREDEVSFQEGPQLRVLRGTITREDEDFVYVVRDDGEWQIAKSKIVKIHRRTGQKGNGP